MLVLSRKLGERILVPHCELTVTVVAIDGNTVKLGITAPTNVGCLPRGTLAQGLREKVATNLLLARILLYPGIGHTVPVLRPGKAPI